MENRSHPSYTDHALLVPMNKGRSNDHDFVPPTQYKLSRTSKQLPDLSLLETIPKFDALDLNNTEGSSHIPHTIDSSSPLAIFPVLSFCTHTRAFIYSEGQHRANAKRQSGEAG